jgi:hypothetical protein
MVDLLATPAAFALSIMGFFIMFGVLFFAVVNPFFRTLCYLILMISVFVAGYNVLHTS